MKNTYILTGATGFLGCQLSKKILTEGHSIVFIGKSKKDISFKDRIEKLFINFNKDQIFCIEADLEEISEQKLLDQINFINKKIDGIWHLAANLSFKSEDRERVFKTNKEGLRKIIFLTKSLNINLYYTSTAYVHGKNSGTSKEIFFPKPKYFNNPYEESKFEAEQLIKNENNLKYIIFRPSIMYDADAHYVTNFGYYSFLIALFKLKKNLKFKIEKKLYVPLVFFYYKKSLLNLMPSKTALDWMYSISTMPDALGLIFHITNPKPFHVGNVFSQTFDAFNIKIPLFGAPLLISKIYFNILIFIGNLAKPFRPVAQRIHYFKGYLLEHTYYDMKNTRKFLPSDFEKEFEFSKNYIFDLAKKIITNLQNYKSK